ncbi:MAG TPA: TonB-dependent receptor [Phenylobacterium sp.]|nr:TonB-dependent receptor [Phenylobacterium sp.]
MTQAYMRLFMGAAFGAISLASSAAQTVQQEPTGPAPGTALEEVIVTAQKRAENLQNVPIAVTVVQADALSAAGVSQVSELSMLTPGLTITSSGSHFILPRIRGVGQAGGNISLENPVAIYVDGVYYASAAGSMFSLNNIAQISVLKGPQGTLFGRNATGGLIQVTTLDPDTDFGGKVAATVGNKATYGGQLYMTGGLANNVAADLAVYYNNQTHGFGKNLVNNKDVNDGSELALRSKVKAEIGEATTVRLSGDYSRSQSHQPVFRSVYGTLPINRQPFTGGKFDIESDTQPFARNKQAGGSVTIDHDFGGVRLSSISAYRWVEDVTVLDNDALPAPTTIFVPDAQTFVTATGRERTFSQELQLSSDGDGPLTWTGGLYYFHLKGKYSPPVIIDQLNGAVVITINSRPKTESYAAYGQATYAINDRLNFTAGIRYTKEKRSAAGSLGITVGGAPILFIPSEADASKGQFTWRLALDYRPSDQVLAYASYNRGFKSGGFNPTEVPFNSFEPEKIDAYEAGLKLDLADRRVRINPAFFYYDYSNLQALIYVSGQPRTQNAASAKIYGLDVDFIAAISERLTLTGGLSILHDRYGLYKAGQISTPDLVNGGNIITSGDIRGTRLTNTPDWTANLGAEYRIPIGENELSLNANYAYNDGFYNDAENRQHQGGYHLVNASIQFETSKGYTLSAWAKNIGNVAYASQLYTSAAGDKIRMGAGRTFGVTAGAKF